MTDRLYEPDLDVQVLFSTAWERLKGHVWPTVAVFVLYALLTSSGGFWDNDGGLGDLIMFVISGPVTAGTYLYSLRIVRGEEPDLGDIFRGFQVFGKAFAVFVLYAVMVAVGLVLLIVPGIYLAVAFMPAMYLVLDENLGIIDTLRRAWYMTQGYRRGVFLVLLAVFGLNLVGLIAFLIGVIFTGALSLIIGAALYDELARAYRRHEQVAAPR